MSDRVDTTRAAADRLERLSQIGTNSTQTRAPFPGSLDARGRRVGSPPLGGGCVLADSPDYGAFALCTIVIYEVDAGQTALVSARQGWVLKSLPDHKPSRAALAAARQFERTIDEIFDAVIEEGKVRSK